MSEYSQGVCDDGAAILKDGQRMTIEEIIAALTFGEEGRVAAAKLFADFAQRVDQAEPYLRNRTIPRFIENLSHDLRGASLSMADRLPTDYRRDATIWGTALNEAAWEFTDKCPEKSAKLFNNTKEPLRAAILCYLNAVEKEEQ